MAQQVVISFNANANFSDLIGEIKRANAEIGVLQNQLQGLGSSSFGSLDILNKQFVEGMKNSRMWSSTFVDVTNETREFGKHLDQGRLKLKDYFREFNTQVKGQRGMIRKLAEEQVRLQRSVLTTTVGAQGQTRNVLSTPTGLDGLDPATMKALKSETFKIIGKSIQGVSTELINLGKNTQWAGRQLTVGLTVPLTMFAASAATAFREVDKQLTRLAKVYGDIGGATTGEIAAIRKETTSLAKDLAGSLGAPMQDTIGLAADIAATGKTGEDLLKSVAETTRLSILGEVDRQAAMSATLSLQNAFNLSTQQLGESINFLNAVENQTSTSLDDLVTAIPKAGPVVKSLGGDVKDLALFLTAMKEGGINAAEGANALKSGLASIINPTKQTTEVMNNFGIDIQGLVNNNAGDLVGTVQALQVALSKLDPLSKSKAIEQLFGKFQFARMSALFDNLGASGSQTLQVMDLMKASTVELANVADRELSILTESASGKFARQLESFKANMAGVGEGFLGIFSGVLGVLNKLLDGFNNLPNGIKNIMTILGVVVGLAGPLIMLSGVFLNFFGYLTKAAGFMGRLFTGTKGFELLNERIMANKLSTDNMSNSFYDQAKATEVARMEIDKLIASMQNLMAVQETASTGAAQGGGTRIVPPAQFQDKGGFMPGGTEFSHLMAEQERIQLAKTLGLTQKQIDSMSVIKRSKGNISGYKTLGQLGTLGTFTEDPSAAKIQEDMGESMPNTIVKSGTSVSDMRKSLMSAASTPGQKTSIEKFGKSDDTIKQLFVTEEEYSKAAAIHVANMKTISEAYARSAKEGKQVADGIKTAWVESGPQAAVDSARSFATQVGVEYDNIVNKTEAEILTALRSGGPQAGLNAAAKAEIDASLKLFNLQADKAYGNILAPKTTTAETRMSMSIAQGAAAGDPAIEAAAADLKNSVQNLKNAEKNLANDVANDIDILANEVNGGVAGPVTKGGRFSRVKGMFSKQGIKGMMQPGMGSSMALMGLGLASQAIPQTGKVGDIAGGAMMGASAGAMFGGAGMAAGAALGLLATAGKALYTQFDKLRDIAALNVKQYQIDKEYAKAAGLSLKTIGDIQLQNLVGKTEEAATALDILSKAALEASTNTSTGALREQTKGAKSFSEVKDAYVNQYLSYIAAGASEEVAKQMMAAILKAAGREDFSLALSTALNQEKGTTKTEATKKQLENATGGGLLGTKYGDLIKGGAADTLGFTEQATAQLVAKYIKEGKTGKDLGEGATPERIKAMDDLIAAYQELNKNQKAFADGSVTTAQVTEILGNALANQDFTEFGDAMAYAAEKNLITQDTIDTLITQIGDLKKSEVNVFKGFETSGMDAAVQAEILQLRVQGLIADINVFKNMDGTKVRLYIEEVKSKATAAAAAEEAKNTISAAAQRLGSSSGKSGNNDAAKKALQAQLKALEEIERKEKNINKLKEIQLKYEEKRRSLAVDYLAALGAGDMEGALRAQIDMQEESARYLEEKKQAEKDIARDDQKKAIQDKIDALDNVPSGVSGTSNKVSEITNKVTGLMDTLTKTFGVNGDLTTILNQFNGSKELKNFRDSLTKLGFEKSEVDALVGNLKTKIEAAVKAAVNAGYTSGEGGGSGTKANPLNVSSDIVPAGTKGSKNALSQTQIAEIVKEYDLTRGQYFSYKGETYRVGNDGKGSPIMHLFESSGTRQPNAEGKWMGGEIKGYHMGGLMEGVGNSVSDSNLIRASRGEFMHNARAVNYYGVANMERLNNRQVDPRVFENMREAGDRNDHGVNVSIGSINITEPGASADEIIAKIEKKLGAAVKRTTDSRVMKV